jgi:methylmalonyl-CoA mutase N-terminal domain/subunit
MEKIEKIGGMVEAVSSGYVQREVARQAYEFEKNLQEGKVTKVGVNKYTEGVDMEVELHAYNEAWALQQIEQLKALKKSRDNKAVKDSLKALEKAAKEQKNVVPLLVDCCKSYATVGEMANVFRDVFGEHVEPSMF